MSPATSGRVLVIDDEPLVGRAIVRSLRDYDVCVTADAEEAVALIRSERFDVVVCDLQMPKLTGTELLEVASTIDRSIANRFILTSGGDTLPESGPLVAAYLAKPFEMRELREAIAAIQARG